MNDALSSDIIYVAMCFISISILIFIVIHLLFNPRVRTKRKLARRITGEYHAARGSSHLEMLRNARDALASKRDQAQAECKQLDTELQENQSREQMAYEQALVHDLVMHHLTIPGIGPSLARQLQTSVFHGNLTDLYRAESIHGVGATRQRAIRQWIATQQRQLPTLIEGEFFGKKEIENEFKIKNRSLRRKRGDLDVEIERLDSLLSQVATEIARLACVSERDFRDAFTGKPVDRDALDHYVTGVFAEWESMPDWFRDVLQEAGDR